MRRRASLPASVVATLVVATVGTRRVAGHVDYVTDSSERGDPIELLISVFSDPLSLALLGGGGVGILVAGIVYLRVRPVPRDVAVFRETMDKYRDLLPWLLRLSFGLPMVGAGFAGYFFSPSVPPVLPVAFAPSRLFQIGVGFLLLFGLATRATAAVALLVYVIGLPTTPKLLLANEYVTGMIAIVLLGSGRPSADHVLQQIASADGTVYGDVDPVHRAAKWFNRIVDPYETYVPTIVRVGLGLNFLFLGITEKLLAPGPALAVVEKYDLTAVVPVDPGLWVVGAGLTEAALGVVLIIGLFTRAGSLVALAMFTLTLFGLPGDPVLAHITLFGLASVLVITGSGPYAVDEWVRKRVTGAPGSAAPADA